MILTSTNKPTNMHGTASQLERDEAEDALATAQDIVRNFTDLIDDLDSDAIAELIDDVADALEFYAQVNGN